MISFITSHICCTYLNQNGFLEAGSCEMQPLQAVWLFWETFKTSIELSVQRQVKTTQWEEPSAPDIFSLNIKGQQIYGVNFYFVMGF